MEKCVDSDYPETQYDSSKSPQTWTNPLTNNQKRSQQRNKNKEPAKVSRTRKKIAEENRSVGGPDPRRKIANAKGEKSVKEERKKESQLNVLKSRLISARHSVQNNTKIIHRNVPDRIGKYVNSGVRSETKLGNEPNANRSSTKGDGFTLNDYPDTKIRNECLSNKESVTLGNSIETVSGSNNIFEKIFDDCLDSTSVERKASSQETLNLETDDESVAINPKTVEKYTKLLENFESLKKSDARMIEIEKTPKKSRIQNPPSAPVKVKDHSGYYNRKKLRHVCGYCHKIFKSNGKLNSHVYSHTGERPFDCNNCGKAFSSKFKLVRHLLIHSEIRKFVCQICDRTFLRNDHLKNHYKIHDPQKKMYKCTKEHCDKEYSSLMSHKKHMAYHSVEDGDLKCLICNVKFDSKEEVLFHLKSHSGSRLFKSQSDKKFKCDFCDRLFLTRKDVNRHLVVHTGERDFLCQFCPQRFGRKDHLVRHIKKSHVNEGMKTEIKQLMEKTAIREESPPPPPQPQAPLAPPCTSSADVEKDEEQPAEEEKTHIVITVKNPVQKKLKSQDFNNKTKSFRRDTSVPNKKQVPCPKSKGSTTQIFLDNIPNILIIPNNSIILLRNQAGKKKVSGSEGVMNNNSSSSNPNNNNNNNSNNNNSHNNNNNNAGDIPQMAEDFLPVPDNSNTLAESDCNFNINYNYNYNMFQPQFPTSFPYSEPYGNFQQEVPFGQQFENLIFDALTQNELLKKTGSSQDILPGESSSTELHKKVGIVKPMTKTLSEIDKPLFEDPQENLIMNDSILSDFKVDDSGILDSDGGILNNLFGPSGLDATGNELLRNLLMGESSMLSSPLPGFSQIFNNSNAN